MKFSNRIKIRFDGKRHKERKTVKVNLHEPFCNSYSQLSYDCGCKYGECVGFGFYRKL